jgi:hypothetical protein
MGKRRLTSCITIFNFVIVISLIFHINIDDMKKNTLLFLKTPDVYFAKDAYSFLRKYQVKILAQYDNLAIEVYVTGEQLKLLAGSNFFTEIHTSAFSKEYMETLSADQKEIAAAWNLSTQKLRYRAKEQKLTNDKTSSWGAEGYDEPFPYSEISESYLLETIQKSGLYPALSIKREEKHYDQKITSKKHQDLENRLLHIVKDETKFYHLSRLAIAYPELEEILPNLPPEVINDLFDEKKQNEFNIDQGLSTVSEPSCWRMNGEISVGVVFVESSRDGGPRFTSQERTILRSEVQTALNWLSLENVLGNLTWVYNFQNVQIDKANGTNSSEEDYWLFPAMQRVVYNDNIYPAGLLGTAFYRQDMREANNSRHAIVIFITRFANWWHAYANSHCVRICDRRDWGGRTINNVDTHVAHEVSHLFGAADEYAGNSGTPCRTCSTLHGCDRIVNANCEACAAPSYDCVMADRLLKMCTWTRKQIGWPPSLIFLPATMAFGSLSRGSSRTLQFTIRNRTGNNITISWRASPPGSVFEWSAFNGTLNNGASRSFAVTFRPRGNAIETGRLIVSTNAPGEPHFVGFVGKGLGGFPVPGEE